MKKDILLWIIKGGIIASFFTPLIVSGNFIFPFVFPKTAAFQIIVEIIFFAWLLLAIKDPQYRPKRKKLFWALSLFLAVIFIASVLGVDFAHSFWSNYERMTGLVTLLHYFAYFLILTSVLKTRKEWLFMFDFFLIASLFVSFVALGQKFNIKGFLLAGPGRLSATLGNAAYLAAYLLFVVFLAAFMYFQRQSRVAKLYYAAVFVFSFLIFYWTETRGALLGFAAGAILFLAIMIFWRGEKSEGDVINRFRSRVRKISVIALIILVIFIAGIYSLKNSSFVKNSTTLSRLTSISVKEATSQTRLLAWKMSFEGFKQKPILGWGWENYNVVFNKFYDPHLYPVENWFDRAHNIVFDMLISAGLFGFLSFLGIFFVAIWILWRALRQKRIDLLNASLFAILMVAYLFQDFFVFDMLFSYMPLFLILAFLNWVEKTDEPKNVEPAKLIKPNVFFNILFAAIFLFLVYVINIKPALAGYWGIVALRDQQSGADAMLNNFQKSLSYGSFGRFEVRLQILDTAKNMLAVYQNDQNKEASQRFIKFALDESEKTLKERPSDARYGLITGQLNLMAIQIDSLRLNRAAEILTAVLKLSPNRQTALYALGEAKLRQGQTQEGLNYFKKAIEINDSVVESSWNLALAYFSIGEIDNGKKQLAEMDKKFGAWQNESHYKNLANIFIREQDYQAAISYLGKALVLAPGDAELYAMAASAYAEIGDKVKAKEMALKAAELNPQMKQGVDEFINSLDKK